MNLKQIKKYTPYNPKGTKIDGAEAKHRGTPAAKKRIIESAGVYHHCNSEIWTYNCQNLKLWKAIINGSIKIW